MPCLKQREHVNVAPGGVARGARAAASVTVLSSGVDDVSVGADRVDASIADESTAGWLRVHAPSMAAMCAKN